MKFVKLLCIALALITASGCYRAEEKLGPSTYTAEDIRQLFPQNQYIIFGDETYRETSVEWENSVHRWFGKTIFFLGGTADWRPEYDCNRFITLRVAVAQARYLFDSFHDFNAAAAPAYGEFWYYTVPDKSAAHAVTISVRDNKLHFQNTYSNTPVYIEDWQIRSAILIKF